MKNKYITVDSEQVENCPQYQYWMGGHVKTNSGYCRNLCKYRNYKQGEPGSNLIVCRRKK